MTSRKSHDRQHWNASPRNGGYQVFGCPGPPDYNEINNKFTTITQVGNNLLLDGRFNPALIQELENIKVAETVMMHLVWPYIFPTWYKENNDGYSQIRGMKRLLSDVVYRSNGRRKIKDIELSNNYTHYASVYRILLSLYKKWMNDPKKEEPHFDFFTQFLAELVPVANPLALLKFKKAIVLYGVPGTGKTHRAKQLATEVTEQAATDGEPGDATKIVQFHPGYSYADFIVGIRPETNTNGQVNYLMTKGVLYDWAERAAENNGKKYCLIIDEINRANLAEVLGEAMYCLEYRGKRIRLPQVTNNDGRPFKGGMEFYLPPNLYIIGTMNHADRSISGFDMALRRRFAWYRMEPMTWIRSHLDQQEFDEASLERFLAAAAELNKRIRAGQAVPNDEATRIPLNADHQIGDSYFAAIEEICRNEPSPKHIRRQHREKLWLYFLRSLLEDYLGNDVHIYQDALKRLGESFGGE